MIDALYRIGVINVRISASDDEDIELKIANHDDVGTPISFIEEQVANLETAA